MRVVRIVLIASAAAMLGGCGVIHKNEPVTSITSSGTVNSTRWNATLSTPTELAGAVQVRGTGFWAPVAGGSGSNVAVFISNATPGGSHPWSLHRGRCGADEGTVGTESSYPTLSVNEKGNASSSVTIPVPLASSGEYFLSIAASPSNRSTLVACGNLAPPIQ